MPQMKASAIDPRTLIVPKKFSPKLSPEQIFAQISKANSFRKFHFKAIESGGRLHLFNGVGKKVNEFEASHKGEIDCRVYALEEIFLKTPIERRNVGGYKFDFVKNGKLVEDKKIQRRK